MKEFYANTHDECAFAYAFQDEVGQPTDIKSDNDLTADMVSNFVNGHTCDHNIACEALKEVDGWKLSWDTDNQLEREETMRMAWMAAGFNYI